MNTCSSTGTTELLSSHCNITIDIQTLLGSTVSIWLLSFFCLSLSRSAWEWEEEKKKVGDSPLPGSRHRHGWRDILWWQGIMIRRVSIVNVKRVYRNSLCRLLEWMNHSSQFTQVFKMRSQSCAPTYLLVGGVSPRNKDNRVQ